MSQGRIEVKSRKASWKKKMKIDWPLRKRGISQVVKMLWIEDVKLEEKGYMKDKSGNFA